MRAVVQRVTEASIEVDSQVVARIERGLVVLLGIGRDDKEADADYLVRKITGLRIFDDSNNRMNCSLMDSKGSLLIVSQFTLYGDVRKGMRPSFDAAADAEKARHLYTYFANSCRQLGLNVGTGVFQAKMKVALINDGPVTIICDSVRIPMRG